MYLFYLPRVYRAEHGSRNTRCVAQPSSHTNNREGRERERGCKDTRDKLSGAGLSKW